ncbi:pali-domain-containing protein [Fomitiporia mediterranea MF3/22]|uniref:pali-domain-containing protein n=1 Tax=Fomitiporia mediterranea (strain MF3/22) TaxID=694068 RepID=UPI0004408BEC|nr:pali-domain-containing protein [Fomitiporia mediterranea MF3/22]EJD05831.1 pali-domain-containing protein [Fomitiporia mediterranea MF3/22]
MYAATAITPLLLFAAFLLLLLVSLSVPIIKSIDLLKLSAVVSEGISVASVDVTGSVKFGVWGYCVSAVDVQVAGQNFDRAAQCTKPHLGFTFDETVQNALQVSGIGRISDDLTRSVTTVLVIHPIACGLTFLALALSIFMITSSTPRFGTRVRSGATLVASIFAALFTTIIFLVDVIFVAVVRNKLNDEFHGQIRATWGSGTWMTLAATILLWLSCVGACCGIFACGGRRKKYADTY